MRLPPLYLFLGLICHSAVAALQGRKCAGDLRRRPCRLCHRRVWQQAGAARRISIDWPPAGIRFERAYCNSPVCTASRQSFFTGRYPRTIGVTQLKTALPDSEVTAGRDARSGRLCHGGHRQDALQQRLKHGFELRIDTAEHHAWLAKQPKAASSDLAACSRRGGRSRIRRGRG